MYGMTYYKHNHINVINDYDIVGDNLNLGIYVSIVCRCWLLFSKY